MKRTFITLFVVAAIAGLFLMVAKRSATVVRADGNGLVGTWLITVNVNTPPGAPPFSFNDYIAFQEGGTLTATSTAFNSHTSEVLAGPLGVDTSDGYGVWAGDGDGAIRVTFNRFLFAGANNSATALYGSFSQGQNIGTDTVEAVGTVRGDTVTGQFTTQFSKLDGGVVFPGSGTFSGTRIKIKPLAQ